jgi:hypothetical protein
VVRLRVVPTPDLLPALVPSDAATRLLADLPLPRLVEVAFDPGQEPDRAAIAAKLSGVADEAVIGAPVAGGAEGRWRCGACGCWAGPAARWRWRA